MNLIVIGSVALLLLIVIVTLVIFRPRGDFKPATNEPTITMSQDKPVVLRFPGPSPEELGDEAPRDMLHRIGDIPADAAILPPNADVKRASISLPESGKSPLPPANHSGREEQT